MRMLMPGLRFRQQADQLLALFFHEHRSGAFRRALGMLSRFYRLPAPRVQWFEYLDWGKTAGRTYENGRIHLVHPENWKNGRKYNSERQWIHTVYHEVGHYVLWSDPEWKADTFAYRFVRGISPRSAGQTHQTGKASRARRKASLRRSGPRRRRPRSRYR